MTQSKVYLFEKPKSHESLAEELGMDTRDPFTRMFVAALYWRAVAEYFKERSHD